MRCVSEYSEYVTVQQLSGTPDGHGHIDNTDDNNWSAYTTSYAAVQTKGGREFWKVDQVAADVSHVWHCPYSDALASATPAMRLVHETVPYEMLSVIDVDMAHEQIEIQTRRAV